MTLQVEENEGSAQLSAAERWSNFKSEASQATEKLLKDFLGDGLVATAVPDHSSQSPGHCS